MFVYMDPNIRIAAHTEGPALFVMCNMCVMMIENIEQNKFFSRPVKNESRLVFYGRRSLKVLTLEGTKFIKNSLLISAP